MEGYHTEAQTETLERDQVLHNRAIQRCTEKNALTQLNIRTRLGPGTYVLRRDQPERTGQDRPDCQKQTINAYDWADSPSTSRRTTVAWLTAG